MGTLYNHLQVHTDIAVLIVPGRLQDKLSLRNVAEMFLTRGFTFTHETVRDWVDETYVKVAGRWCYLTLPPCHLKNRSIHI